MQEYIEKETFKEGLWEFVEHVGEYLNPPEKIRPSARAIIVKDNKILLSCETRNNVYMSPGGGLEEGETLEECCCRELQEETGYIVKPIKLFAVVNEYSFETLYINNYFICEIAGECNRNLTENEIYQRVEPKWVEIPRAVEIFGEYESKPQDQKSLYFREYTIINKYLNLLNI